MLIWDDFDWSALPKDATRDQIIKEHHGDGRSPSCCKILNKTTNFKFWEGRLGSELASVDCAGHIFHERDGTVPIHVPIPKDLEKPEDFDARKFAFMEEYAAIYIINLHLPKKFAIRHNDNVTAKTSYDRMAARYMRSRAKKIHEVTQEFLDVRLRDEDTFKYSLDF